MILMSLHTLSRKKAMSAYTRLVFCTVVVLCVWFCKIAGMSFVKNAASMILFLSFKLLLLVQVSDNKTHASCMFHKH